MDTRINGRTRLLGVIGKPIKHTLSPAIHNYCFDHYGIDAAYLAFECDVHEVKATVDAIRRLNIRGCNVTMPCKTEIAKYMDKLSPAAKFIGAVNTVVNDNGVLTGDITDGLGVVLDLKDQGFDIAGKKVTLLGAGGAAKAVMVQCALDGAASITVFNRSEKGVNEVKGVFATMKAEGVACKMECFLLSDSDLMHESIRNSDILINATSVGMEPKQAGISLVTDMSVFREDLVVYDVVYNPLVTKLMADARANGCKTVIGGKGMLLWQAAGAFRLFAGLDMPVWKVKAYLEGRDEDGFVPLADIEAAL